MNDNVDQDPMSLLDEQWTTTIKVPVRLLDERMVTIDVGQDVTCGTLRTFLRWNVLEQSTPCILAVVRIPGQGDLVYLCEHEPATTKWPTVQNLGIVHDSDSVAVVLSRVRADVGQRSQNRVCFALLPPSETAAVATSGAQPAKARLSQDDEREETDALVRVQRGALAFGSMEKQKGDGTAFVRRWFILGRDQLWYCKPQAEHRRLTCVPLLGATACHVVGERSFQLSTGQRSYVLRTRSRAETLQWVDAILHRHTLPSDNSLLAMAEATTAAAAAATPRLAPASLLLAASFHGLRVSTRVREAVLVHLLDAGCVALLAAWAEADAAAGVHWRGDHDGHDGHDGLDGVRHHTAWPLVRTIAADIAGRALHAAPGTRRGPGDETASSSWEAAVGAAATAMSGSDAVAAEPLPRRPPPAGSRDSRRRQSLVGSSAQRPAMSPARTPSAPKPRVGGTVALVSESAADGVFGVSPLPPTAAADRGPARTTALSMRLHRVSVAKRRRMMGGVASPPPADGPEATPAPVGADTWRRWQVRRRQLPASLNPLMRAVHTVEAPLANAVDNARWLVANDLRSSGAGSDSGSDVSANNNGAGPRRGDQYSDSDDDDDDARARRPDTIGFPGSAAASRAAVRADRRAERQPAAATRELSRDAYASQPLVRAGTLDKVFGPVSGGGTSLPGAATVTAASPSTSATATASPSASASNPPAHPGATRPASVLRRQHLLHRSTSQAPGRAPSAPRWAVMRARPGTRSGLSPDPAHGGADGHASDDRPETAVGEARAAAQRVRRQAALVDDRRLRAALRHAVLSLAGSGADGGRALVRALGGSSAGALVLDNDQASPPVTPSEKAAWAACVRRESLRRALAAEVSMRLADAWSDAVDEASGLQASARGAAAVRPIAVAAERILRIIHAHVRARDTAALRPGAAAAAAAGVGTGAGPPEDTMAALATPRGAVAAALRGVASLAAQAAWMGDSEGRTAWGATAVVAKAEAAALQAEAEVETEAEAEAEAEAAARGDNGRGESTHRAHWLPRDGWALNGGPEAHWSALRPPADPKWGAPPLPLAPWWQRRRMTGGGTHPHAGNVPGMRRMPGARRLSVTAAGSARRSMRVGGNCQPGLFLAGATAAALPTPRSVPLPASASAQDPDAGAGGPASRRGPLARSWAGGAAAGTVLQDDEQPGTTRAGPDVWASLAVARSLTAAAAGTGGARDAGDPRFWWESGERGSGAPAGNPGDGDSHTGAGGGGGGSGVEAALLRACCPLLAPAPDAQLRPRAEGLRALELLRAAGVAEEEAAAAAGVWAGDSDATDSDSGSAFTEEEEEEEEEETDAGSGSARPRRWQSLAASDDGDLRTTTNPLQATFHRPTSIVGAPSKHASLPGDVRGDRGRSALASRPLSTEPLSLREATFVGVLRATTRCDSRAASGGGGGGGTDASSDGPRSTSAPASALRARPRKGALRRQRPARGRQLLYPGSPQLGGRSGRPARASTAPAPELVTGGAAPARRAAGGFTPRMRHRGQTEGSPLGSGGPQPLAAGSPGVASRRLTLKALPPPVQRLAGAAPRPLSLLRAPARAPDAAARGEAGLLLSGVSSAAVAGPPTLPSLGEEDATPRSVAVRSRRMRALSYLRARSHQSGASGTGPSVGSGRGGAHGDRTAAGDGGGGGHRAAPAAAPRSWEGLPPWVQEREDALKSPASAGGGAPPRGAGAVVARGLLRFRRVRSGTLAFVGVGAQGAAEVEAAPTVGTDDESDSSGDESSLHRRTAPAHAQAQSEGDGRMTQARAGGRAQPAGFSFKKAMGWVRTAAGGGGSERQPASADGDRGADPAAETTRLGQLFVDGCEDTGNFGGDAGATAAAGAAGGGAGDGLQWRAAYGVMRACGTLRLHAAGLGLPTASLAEVGPGRALALALSAELAVGSLVETCLAKESGSPPAAVEAVEPNGMVWVLLPVAVGVGAGDDWLAALRMLHSVSALRGPVVLQGPAPREHRLSRVNPLEGALAARAGRGGASSEAGAAGGSFLLMQGVLFKRGRLNTAWRRRLGVLRRNGTLQYFVPGCNPHAAGAKVQGEVELGRMLDVFACAPRGPDDHPFDVVTPDRHWHFRCESHSDMRRWVLALRCFKKPRLEIASAMQRRHRMASSAEVGLGTDDLGDMLAAISVRSYAGRSIQM